MLYVIYFLLLKLGSTGHYITNNFRLIFRFLSTLYEHVYLWSLFLSLTLSFFLQCHHLLDSRKWLVKMGSGDQSGLLAMTVIDRFSKPHPLLLTKSRSLVTSSHPTTLNGILKTNCIPLIKRTNYKILAQIQKHELNYY